MQDTIYQRTEIVIGKDRMQQIKQKHVVIFGIGGVGSYVLEAISRFGIGKITIVDKDVIDITNINRQLIALSTNVGKIKVEEAKKRIREINSEIDVIAIRENVTKENIDTFFEKQNFDYVVDAVDNIEAKIAIIKKCEQEKVPCISSMGMGNKMDPFAIHITTIDKTNTCPLAKMMRKKLREIGITKQKVIYSTELPIEKKIETKTLGSVSFVPSVAGLMIASEVIKDLLK